ncbi:MAG TPA: hypothetical protein VF601_19190 [Beijerinckiaceae bacterium]|jgi:hypothetical protein
MAESQESGGAVFAEVLGRLIDDEDYRASVEKDPHRLASDYEDLTTAELGVLVTVWQACLGAAAGGSKLAMQQSGGGNCCCCCCCP